MGTQQQQQVNERKDKLDDGVSQVAAQFVTVTLNSEMDFYLRNGRNGDFFFFYEMELQISILFIIWKMFYLNIKGRHAYHLIVLFKVF